MANVPFIDACDVQKKSRGPTCLNAARWRFLTLNVNRSEPVIPSSTFPSPRSLTRELAC